MLHTHSLDDHHSASGVPWDRSAAEKYQASEALIICVIHDGRMGFPSFRFVYVLRKNGVISLVLSNQQFCDHRRGSVDVTYSLKGRVYEVFWNSIVDSFIGRLLGFQ